MTSHAKTFLTVCHFQTDRRSNGFRIRLKGLGNPSGRKESHFYSFPFGQAEASIYYPNVISTNPPNFLMSRVDFTVLL